MCVLIKQNVYRPNFIGCGNSGKCFNEDFVLVTYLKICEIRIKTELRNFNKTDRLQLPFVIHSKYVTIFFTGPAQRSQSQFLAITHFYAIKAVEKICQKKDVILLNINV